MKPLPFDMRKINRKTQQFLTELKIDTFPENIFIYTLYAYSIYIGSSLYNQKSFYIELNLRKYPLWTNQTVFDGKYKRKFIFNSKAKYGTFFQLLNINFYFLLNTK